MLRSRFGLVSQTVSSVMSGTRAKLSKAAYHVPATCLVQDGYVTMLHAGSSVQGYGQRDPGSLQSFLLGRHCENQWD